MKLSWKTMGVIVALIVVALGGLVLLQATLLDSASKQKEQAFRQNVSAALGAIVQKLEIGEAAAVTLNTVISDSTLKKAAYLCIDKLPATGDSIRIEIGTLHDDSASSPRLAVENDTLRYFMLSPQHVRIEALRSKDSTRITLVDTFQSAGDHMVAIPDDCRPTSGFLIHYDKDSNSVTKRIAVGTGGKILPQPITSSEKIKVVTMIINNLTASEEQPIEQRLRPSLLDSTIRASLAEFNIDLTYAYAVSKGNGDSLAMISREAYVPALRKSEFRARLFPTDFFSSPKELILYFPEYRSYIRQQMTPLFILTILFMLIITACFVYTIRIITRQKQFSARLIDFINNMTHEFKTPLSTVELASDALLREDVASNESKVLRFSRMIKDENNRMRSQVDKILQMAVLEERDYELTLADVDAHEVITRAVASMTLHIESREGVISCELNASHHIITADIVHFANVIHNLLENANKYSPDKPDILIKTENKNSGLEISIQDHGLGISAKDKNLVFEKYYRVSSGNVQNVRGFGIGLSYVKLMVDAMGGKTFLESEPGKGTVVRLFFPLSSV